MIIIMVDIKNNNIIMYYSISIMHIFISDMVDTLDVSVYL